MGRSGLVESGRIRVRRDWEEGMVLDGGRVSVGFGVDRAAMLIIIWKVISLRGSIEWMAPRVDILVVEVILVALVVRRPLVR